MKLYKYLMGLLFAPALMMTACSEYEDTEVASPSVDANCPAVRFSPANTTYAELAPNATSFTLTVIRDGSDAAEYPINVVTNEDNAFNVPSTVSFAAGEKEATIEINMASSAEVGKELALALSFADEYVNPYKTEYSTYMGTAMIVKWNVLGTGQFFDSFCYTTETFAAVYEVTVEQRDDQPSQYRINNPYSTGILEAAEWTGWIGGTTQDYIVFSVSNKDVITWSFWYTNLLYQGVTGQEIKAYHPSALNNTTASKVKRDAEGNILYFGLNPYYYIDDLGGFGVNPAYLGFPGFDLAGALGVGVWTE